jgi:hypothetical protein
MRSQQADAVLEALAHHGLLLKQDKRLPSVVGIVTGESVSGSWWGHPRSHEIFAILQELADHPDVLIAKLLFGKDTLVHRPLWPDLLAVGSERADWQTRGLASDAVALLEQIDLGAQPVLASGAAARELQVRLLAAATEVHTESGRHAMALESWTAWSKRLACAPSASAGAGRQNLEAAATRFGAPPKALPWPGRL